MKLYYKYLKNNFEKYLRKDLINIVINGELNND